MYKVKAVTYTGAGFRGMEDETDGQIVMLTFAKDIEEDEITTFLLNEFSYGIDEEDAMSMDFYIDGLQSFAITQFDGCGGVFEVWEDDKLLYKEVEDSEQAEADAVARVYELNITRDNLDKTVASEIGKLYGLKNLLECEYKE